MPRTLVVAIGGNAILREGQKGTIDEQKANLKRACDAIVCLIRPGTNIVLTHGNGPQVGNILIQNDAGKKEVPAMPLDVCGAQSQGCLGYLIQQSLENALGSNGIKRDVVTIVTQCIVSESDPAFRNPTKPVGPFYPEGEMKRLVADKGWKMKDLGQGRWRRVVPSPAPIEIVEHEMIKRLQKAGTVVIAAGGGGIPVIRRKGFLEGVEAVIDKDLASATLARDILAQTLVILTDVEKVSINFKKPDQKPIDRIAVRDLRAHLASGQFPAGSMGPKMEAALLFLNSRMETSLDSFLPAGAKGQRDQRKVVITSLEKAEDAILGRTGTTIVPD